MMVSEVTHAKYMKLETIEVPRHSHAGRKRMEEDRNEKKRQEFSKGENAIPQAIISQRP